MKTIIILLSLLLIACTSPSKKSETVVADAFFASCFRFASDKNGFQIFLERKNVSKLPAENSRYFLKGMKGEAWGVNILGNKIALTWLEDNTCSFFAQKVSVDDFMSDLNSKLTYAKEKHGAIFEPLSFSANTNDTAPMVVTLIKSDIPSLKEGTKIYLSTNKDSTKNISVMLSTRVQN